MRHLLLKTLSNAWQVLPVGTWPYTADLEAYGASRSRNFGIFKRTSTRNCSASSKLLKHSHEPLSTGRLFIAGTVCLVPESIARHEHNHSTTTAELWRRSLHFPMLPASFPAVDTAIGVREEG